MIDFQNVSKLLGGKDILKNVSFRINKGERIGFVGPNGAGKSTVFSMICGDISADHGEILKPEKARIGGGIFRSERSRMSWIAFSRS